MCLNIVGGNAKYSSKDQARYANHALGSIMELSACMEIALDLKYIRDRDLILFKKLIEELYFKIIAYKKSKFK